VVGKTLGEGTFGKVKLGTHILTGEKVGIKVLDKSRIVEVSDVQRVAREIKILKRNRHQNVIKLFEVIDTPKTIFLIMDYADRGELFDYIVKNQRVQEPQACYFFHQLVDGVAYLHSLEVTHRDLKPENLLLQSSPHGLLLKIVDFGLSNTHDGGRKLKTACGSPCYAAPEMIAGNGEKAYEGPKADIWSMGVILFALVCGYLPFEDSNTSQLYKKILAGSYKAPKWLSRDVSDLIKRILNTNPRERYTIEHIRQHRWYGMVHVKIPAAIQQPSESELDEAILDEVETLGLERKAVVEAVASGMHNNHTATYHLLQKKMGRRQHDTHPPSSGTVRSHLLGTKGRVASAQRSSKQAHIPVQTRGARPVVPKLKLPKAGKRAPKALAIDGLTNNPQPLRSKTVRTPRQRQIQRPEAIPKSARPAISEASPRPISTNNNPGSSHPSSINQPQGDRQPNHMPSNSSASARARPAVPGVLHPGAPVRQTQGTSEPQSQMQLGDVAQARRPSRPADNGRKGRTINTGNRRVLKPPSLSQGEANHQRPPSRSSSRAASRSGSRPGSRSGSRPGTASGGDPAPEANQKPSEAQVGGWQFSEDSNPDALPGRYEHEAPEAPLDRGHLINAEPEHNAVDPKSANKVMAASIARPPASIQNVIPTRPASRSSGNPRDRRHRT